MLDDRGRDREPEAVLGQVALIWDPRLADYDLGPAHPLNPLRLVLTVELMEAFGLLAPDVVIAPREATEGELRLVHSSGYIESVRHAGDWASDFRPSMGLGTEDNPIYPGMHEIAALTCGGSIQGIEEVLSGRRTRAFSIAGGMHHAHRSRAAGFSIYNDAAVGIAAARETRPDLKVLYVDIDAHHGDGVQEAFAGSAEVLTISVHESGLHAFPGTGFPGEIGYGAGMGYSANVPLPSHATDACFALAFTDVIAPLARAFGPDIIVSQLGVDAHYSDPQTDLGLTLPGYHALVRGIIALADELCGGRLVALGGGGYHIAQVVPLAWTWVLAELGGIRVGDEVPESWRAMVRSRLDCEPPVSMGERDSFDLPPEASERVLAATAERVREVLEQVTPHMGLAP